MFERLPRHAVSPLDFDTFVRRAVIVIMTRFIVTRLPQNVAASAAPALAVSNLCLQHKWEAQ